MKKYPSVTVLVTMKNSAHTIKKCIDSILKLDYPNKKIMCVDAFSTDGTYEILKKYGNKIELYQKKGNISIAYNWAYKKINTDFIAFTNADCVVKRDWLKKLISGFTSDDIVATAGYCATPKKVNRLQRLIGAELEYRFKTFPEFISRAPDMNLCVRTKIAKKIPWNEKLDVTQETDWGYRLTKYGKMRYIPDAIVYHYHRATWKNYFKQQMKYGRNTPILFLKHKVKIKGDHISTPFMMAEEYTFLLFLFFNLLAFLMHNIFFIISLCTFIFLLFLYLVDILRFSSNIRDIITYYRIYLTRTIAWTIGLGFGILDIIRGKK